MTKQTIYVAGYPKSGTTWLTRLLGDVLNSPTGGCMLQEDSKEIATEGQGRPGNYIVRKGHFVLIDDDTGSVVPRPHRLAWKQLTDEKIVFIVRDPRDICVSGAYHWQVTLEQFLDKMIKGDIARCGRWDKYVKDWLGLHIGLANNHEKTTCLLTYENLLDDTYFDIKFILDKFNVEFNSIEVKESIERQTFERRKAQIGDNEKELRRNNMRKGITGDWRNYFTQEMNDRIWSEFGWMMEKLGYAK